MSKNFVFALTLLISAAASAMDNPFPTIISLEAPVEVTVSTVVAPTLPEVALEIVGSSVKEGTGAGTAAAQEIPKSLARRLAAPFVWVVTKTKNGVISAKDGVVYSAFAVKKAPGQYINWFKNDKIKATAITAAALVVAGGIGYVAYNWYQQKKAEKKRTQELLNSVG